MDPYQNVQTGWSRICSSMCPGWSYCFSDVHQGTDDPTAKPRWTNAGSTYTVCCCKHSVPHKIHAFPASSRTRMVVCGGSFDVAERAWPIIEHRPTGFKSFNIVESCQSFVSIYLPVYLSLSFYFSVYRSYPILCPISYSLHPISHPICPTCRVRVLWNTAIPQLYPLLFWVCFYNPKW